MAVLSVFFLVKKVLAWVLAPPGSGGKKGDARGGDMVKDPVCGTYIPTDRAVQRQIGREIRYFCSEECAKKFAMDHATHLS
ncbi:MAG: hypothetical protein HZA19_02070 [Nitrospirae bacterium]|nr:hypothetical protein [Nitrospirota bacterium]